MKMETVEQAIVTFRKRYLQSAENVLYVANQKGIKLSFFITQSIFIWKYVLAFGML
jgi:hypothetical protein